MSEQWSDKILQGLHNASEMLAEQKRQIEELRAERDAAREQRDAAREEANKQHEGALEQNRLLKLALVELDEARNQLDGLRSELVCLQGQPVVCEEDTEPTLAAGTGPVAVPSTEQAGLSGDLAGVLNVVARHSREIGTLQDDIRKLREDIRAFNDVLDTTSNRVSELERARPVTSAAMGTSEGLL